LKLNLVATASMQHGQQREQDFRKLISFGASSKTTSWGYKRLLSVIVWSNNNNQNRGRRRLSCRNPRLPNMEINCRVSSLFEVMSSFNYYRPRDKSQWHVSLQLSILADIRLILFAAKPVRKKRIAKQLRVRRAVISASAFLPHSVRFVAGCATTSVASSTTATWGEWSPTPAGAVSSSLFRPRRTTTVRPSSANRIVTCAGGRKASLSSARNSTLPE